MAQPDFTAIIVRTPWTPSVFIIVFVHLLLFHLLSVQRACCVTVAVVYETADQQQLARILQKSMNEANSAASIAFDHHEDRPQSHSLGVPPPSASRRVWMSVVSMTVEEGQSTARIVRDLCATLDNNSISAVLSLGRGEGTTMAAVIVSAQAGVPVLGYAPGYSDRHYKDLNSLFQALNPSVDAMADAACTLLLANGWLSSTYVSDNSETSSSMGRAIASRLRTSGRHAVLTSVIIPTGSSPSAAFDALSDVYQRRSRVLLVHCTSRRLTVRLIQQARRLDMTSGQFIWLLLGDTVHADWTVVGSPPPPLPIGSLHLRFRPTVHAKSGRHMLRASLRLLATALVHSTTVMGRPQQQQQQQPSDQRRSVDAASCWFPPGPSLRAASQTLSRELNRLTTAAILGTDDDEDNPRRRPGTVAWERREGGGGDSSTLRATVDLLNLVETGSPGGYTEWRPLGNVSRGRVHLDAVVWPGDTLRGPPDATAGGRWRVVGALAPPFVMTSEPLGNHSCLVGVPCLRVATHRKEELVAACTDYARGRRAVGTTGTVYNVTCCHGYSVDLLVNAAKELRIDYVFYLVADNRFGSYRPERGEWDGIVADLKSGAAHLAFAPLSVTAARIRHVDFSTPYYFSGVSFLTSTKFREVPLLAFLAPFSPGLWIAIFGCLHVIAVTAAIYEWLSPFGLNPWGRQRTKNFSLASALWVTWSLLFSHLVAFKAPKSWPNKVLINLWGCFSVIFLASYTANIAALFAGLFFQASVNDFNDQSLLTQRVGTARGTAGESFLATKHRALFEHMRPYIVNDFDDGVTKLRNGDLDLLVGDTPVLDFYRGQEAGCTLRAVGPVMNEDTYAIGLNKGSPLKESISSLIVKYNANGYLDYLTARWYHGLPCMRTGGGSGPHRPMRLSIRAVAGVFIMLCLGMVVGVIILCLEHVFYKHALPDLRAMPKGTVWRSPNLMFFSQKLYRFINCVELVSPHHSAKELVNNLRTGQITSLFQKSIKRKEQDQRRRRKSKAQFFEMIQEIRRLRKNSRDKESSTAGPSSARSCRTSVDQQQVQQQQQQQRPSLGTRIRFRLLSQDVHPTTIHRDAVHRASDRNRCDTGYHQVRQRQTSEASDHLQADVGHDEMISRTTSDGHGGHLSRPSFYSEDDPCAGLIERVERAGRRRRPRPSSDDSSSDDGRRHRTASAQRHSSSPMSVSLGDIYVSSFDTREGEEEEERDERRRYEEDGQRRHGRRSRLQRVRSFDDLARGRAETSVSDGAEDDGRGDRHRPGSDRSTSRSERRDDRSMARRHRRLQHHAMPMTKFDFFDLPPRLNDERLKRLSKEDIVLLWQNAERELRRRLRTALAEKHDLEWRLRAAALDQKPP